jgi:hypothetical protein
VRPGNKFAIYRAPDSRARALEPVEVQRLRGEAFLEPRIHKEEHSLYPC